ncbi:MAG: hypothetical protein Kow0069_34310 [Promethearchaeota archaeon]
MGWKNLAHLEKEVSKSKFFKKCSAGHEPTSVNSVNVKLMDVDERLAPRVELEAVLGTDVTRFRFETPKEYPTSVVGYRPVTSQLSVLGVDDFVFLPLEPRENYNVDALLEGLFHLVKKDLDPLSKALNKDPEVKKTCKSLYRGWDSKTQAYQGDLFPFVGVPKGNACYGLVVVVKGKLRHAEKVVSLAESVAAALFEQGD